MLDPLTPAQFRAIEDEARRVLQSNIKEGRDGRTQQPYSYLCPSRTGGYPWQWFWDSCFHAIVMRRFDVELAKAELRTLWSAQDADGFIPHVVYWGAGLVLAPPAYWQSKLSFRPHRTALMQPPVLAQAALAVAEAAQDDAFLAEAVDRCKRYYGWLRDHRDPDADGLISVISPYETGMDHLPAYDTALGVHNPSRLGLQLRDRLLDLHNLVLGRNYNLDVIFKRNRFNVEDVLVNCLYAQGLRDLAKMCALSGDNPGCDSCNHLAERTEQAILARCYDENTQAYFSLAGTEERQLKVLTASSLAPLILDSIPLDRSRALVEQHLLSEKEFWLTYPAPSVAASEPSFRPASSFLIWRGPTWININWLLHTGLSKHGYNEAAAGLARRSAELALRSGFREFYNPMTGEGAGARDFGWSTLVVDMISDG